jgi:hypothetical protein
MQSLTNGDKKLITQDEQKTYVMTFYQTLYQKDLTTLEVLNTQKEC